MKRPGTIVWFLVLGALVVGLVAWVSEPEYGSDYSEVQRRLWNERRALYPPTWCILSDGEMNPDRAEGLERIVPLDAIQLNNLLAQHKKANESLRKGQIEFRDGAGPEYPFGDVDVARINHAVSADRMNHELLEQARLGNSDACLKLIAGTWRTMGNMSWGRAWEIDCWLKKAEASGRRGTKFLRQLLEWNRHQLKIRIRESIAQGKGSRFGAFPAGSMPLDYHLLSGYDEFVECLKSGDFLLYQSMVLIMSPAEPKVSDKEKQILIKALRDRIDDGDVEAMENMAILLLSLKSSRVSQELYQQTERAKKLIGVFPKKWGSYLNRVCIYLGIIDVEDTETMRSYMEGVRCARKAARHGSLIGMDYWLGYGQIVQGFWSRQDWDEVFLYHRTLLDREYVPYVKNLNRLPSIRSLDSELMHCYYKDESFEKFVLATRPKAGSRLPREQDTQQLKKSLDDWVALNGCDAFLRSTVQGIKHTIENVTPEILAVYQDKVLELAEAGNMYARVVLGRMYEQGFLDSPDWEKAWYWYGKSMEREDETDIMPVFLSIMDKVENLSFCSLDVAKRLHMLSLAIRQPELAKKDPEQLKALAKNLDTYATKSGGEVICFLLGQAYEHGVGLQQDKSKALAYYKQGEKFYPSCAEGVRRLEAELSEDALQTR